jgi:hypothetical protein
VPGQATKLGPFVGGLHNSSGSGEFITNDELYELINMEVDTDGSLANRPQINLFNATGLNTNACTMLGTYLPSDGRKFIVVYNPNANQVHLIDTSTGASASNTPAGVTSVCCIQYANKLWVVATNASTAGGGYFDAPTPTSLTWTAVAAMPRGEAVAQYRERIWIACGMGATANTSRFYYSAAGDPASWGGTDFVDVAPGNGQKLVSLVRLGSDLVLFKEHSTHKFTYSTDPRKAELNEIDATIGVPAINCIVVYNNNTIYCLHDNAVYELFQYTYTRISATINMVQDTDLDLFAKDQYGLTLHRDRLFVRYFKNLYVYSLRVKRWCSWVSDRKFSKVVVIPSATVGLDTAYACSASQAKPTEFYYFQDLRRTDDTGVVETISPLRVGALGTTPVNGATYNANFPAASAVNDWIYCFHIQDWTVAEAAPAPSTWTLIANGSNGAQGNGTQWFIWRHRKTTVGDTFITVTMPSAHTCRCLCIAVTYSLDGYTFGNNMPARAAANPSVSTIPGINNIYPKGSLVLTTLFNRNTDAGLTPPPTVTGTTTYNTTVPSTQNPMQIVTASKILASDQSIQNAVVSWTGADFGQIGGVQLVIPAVTQSVTPAVEVFKGQITTKTYDFDVPQMYKVHFWWGLSVATSGKFTASLVIPNARKNMTWREAFTLYGTWAVAIANKQAWSSNANVIVIDTVLPTLGKYARKFIKLMKKVRFRQVYYTIVFDILGNGGIADASLRVYDITVLIKQKETVVKETS